MLFGGFQSELHVNAADHENAFLCFDLAYGLRREAFRRSIDFTRLQRASEGSGQSTSRRGDYIIERRRVWLEDVGRYLVMLRYGAMHAKQDRP